MYQFTKGFSFWGTLSPEQGFIPGRHCRTPSVVQILNKPLTKKVNLLNVSLLLCYIAVVGLEAFAS